MKYRRKPIVVDAEQFTNDVDQKQAERLGLVWREMRGQMKAGGWYTSEGQRVAEGMWLVKGFGWMTDDDFNTQYDRADKALDDLAADAAALRQLIGPCSALQMIADQPCQHKAEGSSTDVDCSETSACPTEWCHPCLVRHSLATYHTEKGGK